MLVEGWIERRSTEGQLRLGRRNKGGQGTEGMGSQGRLEPEVLVPSPWRRQGEWDPEHKFRENPSKGTGEDGAKAGRAWTPASLRRWGSSAVGPGFSFL